MADAHSTVTYKDIPGFPGYRAGSDGTVWSCWQLKPLGGRSGTTAVQGNEWKKMTPCVAAPGYLVVNLKGKTVRVHVLVLLAFVGPRPKGAHACHNDGEKTNNSLSNLRWDTVQANVLDRNSHGTHNKGERNRRHKYAAELVRNVRRRHAALKGNRKTAPKGTHDLLASEFGITVIQSQYITDPANWTCLS